MDETHRPLGDEPGVFAAGRDGGGEHEGKRWTRNWPVASLAAKTELISSAIYSSAALASVDGAVSVKKKIMKNEEEEEGEDDLNA